MPSAGSAEPRRAETVRCNAHFRMDKQHLALNLAATLANGPWTAPNLAAALKRRLPVSLHKYAAPLGDDLCVQHAGPYAPGAAALAHCLKDATAFGPIFTYCARHNIWPDPDLVPPQMCPTPAFANLNLPPLNTDLAVADWL